MNKIRYKIQNSGQKDDGKVFYDTSSLTRYLRSLGDSNYNSVSDEYILSEAYLQSWYIIEVLNSNVWIEY